VIFMSQIQSFKNNYSTLFSSYNITSPITYNIPFLEPKKILSFYTSYKVFVTSDVIYNFILFFILKLNI